MHDVGHPPFSHITEFALKNIWEKINKIDVSDIYINNATIPISKHRRKQLKARLIEVLGDKLS